MPCLSVVSSVAAIFATALISRAYFNIAFVYFNDLVLTRLLIRDIITGVIEELPVRPAHRRDRLLSRAQREGRRGRRRHRHDFERRHRDHGRDRFRYAL